MRTVLNGRATITIFNATSVELEFIATLFPVVENVRLRQLPLCRLTYIATLVSRIVRKEDVIRYCFTSSDSQISVRDRYRVRSRSIARGIGRSPAAINEKQSSPSPRQLRAVPRNHPGEIFLAPPFRAIYSATEHLPR